MIENSKIRENIIDLQNKKMRDYIDDDSYDRDSEEEEEEEILDVEDEDSLPVKKRVVRKGKNEKFDEDEFDRKVAIQVVNIHKKVRGDDKFSIWVEKNLTHLQNLYTLSNLECSPVEFFTYVYTNSNSKKI